MKRQKKLKTELFNVVLYIFFLCLPAFFTHVINIIHRVLLLIKVYICVLNPLHRGVDHKQQSEHLYQGERYVIVTSVLKD